MTTSLSGREGSIVDVFLSGFVLNYITKQKWIYQILIKCRKNLYKHNNILNQWMLLKFYCKLVILEIHWEEVKRVAPLKMTKIRPSKSKFRDNRFSRNMRSSRSLDFSRTTKPRKSHFLRIEFIKNLVSFSILEFLKPSCAERNLNSKESLPQCVVHNNGDALPLIAHYVTALQVCTKYQCNVFWPTA